MTIGLVMRLASRRKQHVTEGKGSSIHLPDIIKEEGIDHVLLITMPELIELGNVDPILKAFKNKNIAVSLYDGVVPNPTVECIESAVDIFKKDSCKAIVAIGGGSVMDCAKIIGARIARPKKEIRNMVGLMKVRRHIPRIYAIPTTAGTGAESTAGAVVTIKNGEYNQKFTINDTNLLPYHVVLDPELTLTLPPSITASTGLDALSHAIEAYTNRFASAETKKNALETVRLVYENLLKVYNDGNNIDARVKMLEAAHYGGLSINSNFIGYAHALSHSVGGRYHLAHGVSVAVILPEVLEEFGDSITKKLAKLAIAAGIDGKNEKELATAFIDSLREMNMQLGMPKCIEQLRREDFGDLIRSSIDEGNPDYPVPVIWGPETFEKVLLRLMG